MEKNLMNLRNARALFTFILLSVALVISGCNKTPPPAPLSNAITAEKAREIAEGSDVVNVRFGNRYLLSGVATNLTPSGLKLDLAWQSLTNQKRDSLVPLHLVDSEGKIVAQADYKFDPEQKPVDKGARWIDSINIPYKKLVGASAIAIGLLGPDKKWELADSGQRDQGNRRLLIALPKNLPSDGVPVSGNFESLNCNSLSGWAWNKNESNSPITLEIIVDGAVLTNIVAGDFRKDLQNGGIGDGNHGFRMAIPATLQNGKLHTVAVRFPGTPFELKNSPKTVQCPNLIQSSAP